MEQRRASANGYSQASRGGAILTIFVLSAGFVALCVTAFMLARAALPTRSVSQVLYETEQRGPGGR
jgi:hypothetical protein